MIKYPYPIKNKYSRIEKIENKIENKYHNKKIVVEGKEFDSKKEANRYMQLIIMQNTNYISDLKTQVPFELQPAFDKNGKHYRAITYYADFTYIEDGKLIVEDVKSVATAKDKVYVLKKKMFEYKYPEYELKEV